MTSPSITIYICLAIGLFLFIANLLVFYAVLKKKRYSTVDYLIGALCAHGQFYYALTSVVVLAIAFSPKHDKSSVILEYFQDWIACYFGVAFTILQTMLFVDRYLATSRPLFFKMKIRNRFAHIVIGISVCAAVLLASSLVIAQHHLNYLRTRYLFFVCLSAFALVCFVIMLLCYIAICRALLFFAGRQMYIFGSFERTTTKTKTAEENTHDGVTLNNVLETHVANTTLKKSKSVVVASVTSPPHQSQQPKQQQRQHRIKPSKKFSLPAISTNSLTGSNTRVLYAVRSGRVSCPDKMVSERGPPDLPLWLIATLSMEIESCDRLKQAEALNAIKMLPLQRFPARHRAATYNPSGGERRERRDRGYTIVNVVLNLIQSRRNEFDKELRLSQARNLVQILTTTILMYLFWSPFVVSG